MRYLLLCLYLCIFVSFKQQTYCAVYVVTNQERNDGFGAQFQTIIYSVICAELYNVKFVYTPFKHMEHNYSNDPYFIAKKEWLINFMDNFEINKGDAYQIEPNSVVQFFEANLVACVNSNSLKTIKRIFRSNKRRNNYFDDEHLHIVIHIRRQNPHDNRKYEPHIPYDFFLNIINKLRIRYADKNPLFHLHSQGNREDFKKFDAQDVSVHVNESVEDSFTAMVLADVLVTGPSSFSYTAGILSEGIVYYMPFWHPPLPGWILVEKMLS